MRRLSLSFVVLVLSVIGVGIVPQHSVAAPLPPPPVLNTPADGSTSTDTTPTFTGTAVPGAEVDIFVDGNLIGPTTADSGGNFAFRPTTPLPGGDHTATAKQTTDGDTSQESNANDFTIVGPPVLEDPADGTVTNDTTPTFTGTALPGAKVDVLIDKTLIGTTTIDPDGNFSFTPGIPLAPGKHQAAARTRVNGVTSGPSNINDFVIDIASPAAPTLNTPADGSTSTDTTPTFTGTAVPGAEVDILLDGPPIGTTTADPNGNFSFTPGMSLAPGKHQAAARTRVNGVTSGPSNINDFVIDIASPAAPTLNRPADGSVTRDTTPTFTGSAEPRAEVKIFVDGTSIGTTTANEDGEFSFIPTAPLAAGRHEAFLGATDAAGNDSPRSNTNGFLIDTDDPAAPGITSPGAGSTTTDPTPTITGTAKPGGQVIILIDGEEVATTVADENGKFTLTVPDGLSPGEHEVSAIAVDEAGNRSDESSPVSFGVLAARADADSGQSNQLAQTGGTQGWLPVSGVLGILAGAGILAVTRWRRRVG